MRYIGLVDCNNFFVSCERLFRPDLAQRPVVVLSSNDGCVVARSQEIKDKGIPMGAPYFQVKDTLSDIKAEVFSSHFSLYRDISRRVFNVLRRRLGEIEQYSIDECFFMVDSDTAPELALEIRDLVFKEVGISVSVGIGRSKTIAKYAIHRAKKTTGVAIVSPEDWQAVVPTLSLAEIWGVGRSRSQQFREAGLLTVADLLAWREGQVGRHFGVEGVRLQAELCGEHESTIQTVRSPQKSFMSTASFSAMTENKTVIFEALSYHLHEVVRDLVAASSVATHVRILAYPSRFGDYAWQGLSVEVILPLPTNDIFTLSRIVYELLEAHFKPNVPYKKAGIVVTAEAATGMTQSLFSEDTKTPTTELAGILHSLNARFGRSTVRVGGSIRQGETTVLPRREACSPDYTTQWKSLPVVKAG
jgi:DNA polymerase V